MPHHIMFCRQCLRYTLKQECPGCSAKTIPPRPPKYSPEDKYARYRRQVKREGLEREGLA